MHVRINLRKAGMNRMSQFVKNCRIGGVAIAKAVRLHVWQNHYISHRGPDGFTGNATIEFTGLRE